MARGFELTETMANFELLTCFEAFEHFSNPLDDVEKMSGLSDNILFSTLLLPSNIPKPGQWWYYGLEHGQHISFYSMKTLQTIAKQFHYNLYSYGGCIHLFTKNTLSPFLFKFLVKFHSYGFALCAARSMKSKTEEDNRLMASLNSCNMIISK